MKKLYHFSVVIEKDKDGYFAFCPELQGCYTQGESYEGALKNIKDAVAIHLKDRMALGEEIPQCETVSLTSLEIAV
ncbi:MAG: type II toxin-antitoxin system HicB family antitoxin [Candidatus Eremiobacteraeota bacterium]|jgi:predicted RNase H-like HicB family nuclease|nr:type II toxin-antitoxin system HicB family antitoxin [Candidatus Eremiobacteraeota bacterium]